jgi:hypothetical protein
MPYNPITAACALDPRIARIISGGSIVERPTADRPEVVRTVVPGPSAGPRCICAHPGQHAECSPCRCQEGTP